MCLLPYLFLLFLQLLEYDRELSVFKDRLHELEISFPPRYVNLHTSALSREYVSSCIYSALEQVALETTVTRVQVLLCPPG